MDLPKHTAKITDELTDKLKRQMEEVIYLAVDEKTDEWSNDGICLTNEQEKQIVADACTSFIKRHYEPIGNLADQKLRRSEDTNCGT